jgi:hypothetical protein
MRTPTCQSTANPRRPPAERWRALFLARDDGGEIVATASPEDWTGRFLHPGPGNPPPTRTRPKTPRSRQRLTFDSRFRRVLGPGFSGDHRRRGVGLRAGNSGHEVRSIFTSVTRAVDDRPEHAALVAKIIGKAAFLDHYQATMLIALLGPDAEASFAMFSAVHQTAQNSALKAAAQNVLPSEEKTVFDALLSFIRRSLNTGTVSRTAFGSLVLRFRTAL